MLTSPTVSASRAAWSGPRTPRQLPAFRYRKEKSSERRTVCWREPDSNHRSAEEDAIRHSFTDAVRAIMKRIASLMQCRRKSEDEALAIVATMVGALTLARAVDDPELSDRILAAARTLLTSR